jgi:predicted DNA-binding transcriptional regulator AlpA
MTKNEPEWLPTTHLAEELNVSTVTLFRWTKDEKLGFPQPRVVNTRKYWNRDEIRDWMMNQTMKQATNKAQVAKSKAAS